MRKVRGAACVVLGLGVLIGCSTFRDQSKAMVGGGAVAGRDYINGLKPSEKARAYFAQNASDGSKAVTISRTGDGANDTGVRFVANGGVVIPPGASITFENQGYCCDPHLPAPKAGDEYQLVKTSQLIPEQLQPIYRKLLTKASNGDEATLRSMQKLVWALRTAGTEAGYANNLTDNEKRILNSCSEYAGEFELYCSEKLAMSRFWKKLLAKADSYTTINVGGVTYQASDLLDDKVCEKKIKAHLGQLITLGESMPVEHNGFNYGELENGIYTDIRGTGSLKFKATVANSTSQPFTFYPMDYIAQVGSGVSDESESVVYYATASTTQKQRVTDGSIQWCTVDKGQNAGVFSEPSQDSISEINRDKQYQMLSSDEQSRLITLNELADCAYRDGMDIPEGFRPFSQDELNRLGLNKNMFIFDSQGYVEDALLGRDGFGARLLIEERTGNIVVSYRGTGGESSLDLEDIFTDAHQALGGLPREYSMASTLLNAVQAANGDRLINTVGHSLGGGLAVWAAGNSSNIDNLSVATFNAAGLAPENYTRFGSEKYAKLMRVTTNVSSIGDPVSSVKMTSLIGSRVVVDYNSVWDAAVSGIPIYGRIRDHKNGVLHDRLCTQHK